MAGPNDKHRQGGHKPPPSVIASSPASAPEVEPERPAPVAAASPAPLATEPAQADVEPPIANPEVSGGIELAAVASSLQAIAESAKAGESFTVHLDGVVFDGKVAAERPLPPAVPPSYVAVCPIFVGGQRGRIEPGEAYKPANDAERDMLLAQRVIRAS
jgi:hypothetical protein